MDSEWELSEQARRQLAGCGVSAREVVEVLRRPDVRLPAQRPNTERLNGHGLTLVVEDGYRVLKVGLDGADGQNWEAWARERAEFAEPQPEPLAPPAPAAIHKAHKKRSEARFPVTVTNVLDQVHPRLRQAVHDQVDGDYTRLEIVSPTRVVIH